MSRNSWFDKKILKEYIKKYNTEIITLKDDEFLVV
jgi:hypothetical protein